MDAAQSPPHQELQLQAPLLQPLVREVRRPGRVGGRNASRPGRVGGRNAAKPVFEVRNRILLVLDCFVLCCYCRGVAGAPAFREQYGFKPRIAAASDAGVLPGLYLAKVKNLLGKVVADCYVLLRYSHTVLLSYAGYLDRGCSVDGPRLPPLERRSQNPLRQQ